MHEEIIIAGFGGQGVMFFGKLLCQAGMSLGLNVTFLPSYGAEVRGGTAHCHVVLSNDVIPSPVVKDPTILIVMNEPSIIKFEPRLVSGGILVFNSSLINPALSCKRGRPRSRKGGINKKPSRNDIKTLSIPATDMASDLDNIKVANMVILGGLLAYKDILPKESVIKSLPVFLSFGKESLININTKAIESGYNYLSGHSTAKKI